MSLLQRLKAAQQQGDQGGGGGPQVTVTGDGGGGGGGGEPPRRQSMAVKVSLSVPNQGGVRRTSGPRTSSQSSGGRASQSSQGRPSMAGPAGARGMGPSLMGLLASKRLAKRFASRFHNRRAGSRSIPVQKEPSYRMEPHCKFNADKVKVMLKTLLEDKLGKMRYSPKICPNMCKILGDDIKQRVKHMNFDRYKIVSNVMIGQKKDQGLVTCSRCAWDDKLDSFATFTFQNEHIFCTATVFAVYSE